MIKRIKFVGSVRWVYETVTVEGELTTLSPGAVDGATFKGTYVLTQTDIDNGLVENTATVTGNDPGGTAVTATDTYVTSITKTPKIELEKTGVLADTDGDGIIEAGEKINYTFKVTNAGNVPHTMLTISDPLVTVEGVVTLSPIPS